MTEYDTAPAADDTKPCKVCGEAIKKAARVCIHCSNYQDWRAELNISGTVLALMVALGSVLTVLVPVIISALTPVNSSFIFSFQGSTPDFVQVLVTNKGIRPGTVGTIGLLEMNEQTKGFNGPELKVYGPDDDTAVVIKPSESKLLRFIHVFQTSDLYLLHDGGLPFSTAANCKLWLDMTDFVGKFSHGVVETKCQGLWIFLRNMEDQLIEEKQKEKPQPQPQP